MKIKFNIYTSHLLLVTVSYCLAMFSHFMLEKYWSGITDILVIGIWYWNYTITCKAVDRYKEVGKEYSVTTLMKVLCIMILILNGISLSIGPISIFYPVVLGFAGYEIYSLLKYHKLIDKISTWLKR